MIEAIYKLGKEIYKQEYKGKDDTKFKKEICRVLSIPIDEADLFYHKSKDKKIEINEIKLIFNLDNKKIEIKKDDRSLSLGDSFCFLSPNPNDFKGFLGTNNFYYFVKEGLPKLLNKLEKNTEFYNFMKKIIDIFYVDVEFEVKKGIISQKILNFSEQISELKADTKEKDLIQYEQILNGKKIKFTNEKGNLRDDKEFFKFFEKRYLPKIIEGYNENKFKFNKIYFKINGEEKDILNMEYANDYIESLYKIIIEGQFKDIKKDKISHLNGKKGYVSNEFNMPLKIFSKTNNYFFENLSKKNRYKSFSVTKEDFLFLCLGLNFIKKNLRDRLFGTKFYIIPLSNSFVENYSKNAKRLKGKIKKINNNFSKESSNEEKSTLLNKGSFSLLFFKQNQSELQVIRYLPCLDILNIEEIDDTIIDICSLTEKYGNYRLYISDFYKLFYSNIEGDYKKREKELIEWVEDVYLKNKIDINYFLRKFLFNLKAHYYDLEDKKVGKLKDKLVNCFQMILLFNKLKMVRYLNDRMIKYSMINFKETKNYEHFFSNYEEVFNDKSPEGKSRKGLLLLGSVISELEEAQQKKGNKTNLIKLINFNGMSYNELLSLINKLTEKLNVYGFFEEIDKDINKKVVQQNLKSLNEYLIYIKKALSDKLISEEEITYYILFGWSNKIYGDKTK